MIYHDYWIEHKKLTVPEPYKKVFVAEYWSKAGGQLYCTKGCHNLKDATEAAKTAIDKIVRAEKRKSEIMSEMKADLKALNEG